MLQADAIDLHEKKGVYGGSNKNPENIRRIPSYTLYNIPHGDSL